MSRSKRLDAPSAWSSHWRCRRLRCAPNVGRAGDHPKVDQEYTAKIKQSLSDPRISTELVDHLPASATCRRRSSSSATSSAARHSRPRVRHSSLLSGVAKASPKRAKFWTIGKTEEGRDMVLLAIADEATIANLDKYKG
jgi:hypothetical protein